MQNKKTLMMIELATILLSLFCWGVIFIFFERYFIFGWLPSIFFFSFFLAVFSLLIFLETSRSRIKTIGFLVLIPALVLGGSRWYWMAAIFLPLWLIFLKGITNVFDIKENQLRIDFSTPLRFGMPLFVTSLSLLVSSGYFIFSYANPEKIEPVKFNVEVSAENIQDGAKLFSIFYPSQDIKLLSENVSVREYVASKNSGTIIADGEYLQFESGSGSEGIADFVASSVNSQIGGFINNSEADETPTRPLGISVALFLTLKSLGWLLNWPIIWTTRLIFNIIYKMNWLKIEKISKEAEAIIV